jgi:hypothetical protein
LQIKVPINKKNSIVTMGSDDVTPDGYRPETGLTSALETPSIL